MKTNLNQATWKQTLIIALSILVAVLMPQTSLAKKRLPESFVYLRNVAPSIQQEIRYAGYHNFVGRPVHGYHANACILTKKAARGLAEVQNALKKQGLSLKVYDCYRPQRAVNDFITWSQHPKDHKMKQEFYPQVKKSNVFAHGYIDARSTHSSGSTVDLTIVPSPTPKQPRYVSGQRLFACYQLYDRRFHDNSIDMGTGYDCMDKLSHAESSEISKAALRNRMLLASLMKKNGFKPYAYEWWHFTLKAEPFKGRFFDFPVTAKQRSRKMYVR